MTTTVTLYRPVGPDELALIRQSAWRQFPPRLPEQPIFYPVLQHEYATRIARDWNVKASGSGFVTRFEIEENYIRRFEVHEAGGKQFTEYWIPAEELNEFNAHIVGRITVISEFSKDCPRNPWITVYDLAQDPDTIELVQRATLKSRQFGLEPEIALYGSADWWRAISDGRIPTHTVQGTISQVLMSGHGDWPEFDVDSEGTTTRWARLGAQEFYREGKRVKIEYVLQRRRKAWPDQTEQKEILRIVVEP